MLSVLRRIRQRIENRVKVTNGTATVSAEALYLMKIDHWRILRRLCGSLGCVSQENCLNEEECCLLLQVRTQLYAEIRLQRSKDAAVFLLLSPFSKTDMEEER